MEAGREPGGEGALCSGKASEHLGWRKGGHCLGSTVAPPLPHLLFHAGGWLQTGSIETLSGGIPAVLSLCVCPGPALSQRMAGMGASTPQLPRSSGGVTRRQVSQWPLGLPSGTEA